ncbi:nitroreductase [Paramyrothecium foliicola]|nr:nitroreductase [Paramyrothecium foliicola]
MTLISKGFTSPLLAEHPPRMAESFLEAVKSRRTWYNLDRNLPITQDRIDTIARDAVQIEPGAYNSQSNRAVLLFGVEHERLWEVITDVSKDDGPEDLWASRNKKTAAFAAASGTVLFFVDTDVVESTAEKWTALGVGGVGANLQHYNPRIDTEVSKAWSLPSSKRLTAQLVFGGKVGEASTPSQKPVEEKLKVFGSL